MNRLIWRGLTVAIVLGICYDFWQTGNYKQALQRPWADATKETRTTKSEAISFVLGDHMESIEYLPLQPWQKDAIRVAQLPSTESFRRGRTDITNDRICFPPAEHISTDFCCGGNSFQVRLDTRRGHINNPYGCAHLSEHDFERVHETALRHMQPLPSKAENKCDVCQIANILWEKNLTMTFLGDSVTHQMAFGWLCDLQMRNYLVTTQMFPGDATSFHIIISSPHWHDGGLVNMTFINSALFPKTLNVWDDLLSKDILVLNFGVHWAVNATRKRLLPEAFRIGMNQAFSHWSTKEKRGPGLVAFRETSMQHFDSDSGEYYLWGSKGSNRTEQCVPNPQTTMIGWRDELVRLIAIENGINVVTADGNLTSKEDDKKELVMLPFLNFTAELHYLHGGKRSNATGGVVDCTHFCQTPFLWMPLWRSLRISVDRAFHR